MAADTEEVIDVAPLLRTRREKLRGLRRPPAETWNVIIGGAGEYDYIGMIGDFIQEKMAVRSAPTDADVMGAIREAVAEVWRDYARYENRTIQVQLLVGSFTNTLPQVTVVNGASVRDGTDLEAIGLGDATFKSLADRYLFHGVLSTVMASAPAARVFAIYAMQCAKASIPGVGGNTRVITIKNNGELEYVKSLAVLRIQDFFGEFDQSIRLAVQGITHYERDLSNVRVTNQVEVLIKTIGGNMLREYKKLKKELARINADPTIV